MKYITRTVWILSIISLLNDAASDLLYPVLPIYLKSIGYSVMLIALMEIIAELTTGLSKGYFGKMSDHMARRVPFVQLGYALSALAKPLIALIPHPAWVFFTRSLDKLGKGIRTGARDALLSDEATIETKGKIFGFNRSMDTMGAVIGPSIALAYLYFYPQQYIHLFYIAIIPGVLTVISTLLIREKKRTAATKVKLNKVPFFSFLKYWKTSPPEYKKLVIGLLIFTLFNSSDMFLLLKAKDAGLSDTGVIGMYILYNLVYALLSFPIGILADKIGLKKILIIGLVAFAIVYGAIPFYQNIYYYGALFILYGLFSACTEGVSKAWISNISQKDHTATAIGTFNSFQSICLMLASAITGFLWYQFGPIVAFVTISVAAIVSIFYILVMVSYKKPNLVNH